MQNELHGKLEELGLEEILQILGVSRSTGILTLNSRNREALLEFRDGLVVRASSTGFKQNLGELLIRDGLITTELLEQALTMQQSQGVRQRVGVILHSNFNVNLLMIEQAVRQQIRNVLLALFLWVDGTFIFTRCEVIVVDAAYLDPMQLILEEGELLSEQRVIDGHLQADTSNVVDNLSEIAQEVPSQTVKTVPVLVVVDDDKIMAEAVADEFTQWFSPCPVTGTEEALIKIDSLFRSGVPHLVIVDMIMPKMDGSGMLGGLELIRLLHRNFSGIRMVVISDFNHLEAVAEIKMLGHPFVLKPRRGDTGGDLFKSFIENLKEFVSVVPC